MKGSKKKEEVEVIFPDSDVEDEEIELDIFDTEGIQNYQDNYVSEVKDFREFMNNQKFFTDKGDPTTNIVDLSKQGAKTYCIPDDRIPRMFKKLEVCRRKNTIMMIYEKQLEYSG